ncbi:UDP-N-acetylglucosamine transferase subunit ALG14-like protein, partial [Stegodyphus mimosarum]
MWTELNVYFVNIVRTLVCLFFVRVFIVYQRIHKKKNVTPVRRSAAKLMIVLGSGGHTFEMLRLISNLDEKFRPRVYVLANTDILSEQKAQAFEAIKTSNKSVELYTIEKIPRSREVNQSWLSTVFTTLISCFHSFLLVIKHKPEAILCNGPGTCVPLCISAFSLHVLGWKHIKIIYVESICRVHTMSLTGKILYNMADHFLVQWPGLREKYPRAK